LVKGVSLVTKKFKVLLLLVFLLSTGGWMSPGWADTKSSENQFSLVQGTVKVASGGGTTRKVAKGDGVFPGETVQVGSKSQAQVTLFDGSTLDLSADSKITLSKLQQPSSNDKVISMKLALGKVFAQVKKLFSAKSSFEIEAGGVVCGVRGTAFTLNFDGKNKLDLEVLEGKVSTTSGGNTLFFGAGQHCHFVNGQATGNGGSSNNNGGKNGGKGGTTGGNGTGGNNSGTNSNGGNSGSNSNSGSNNNGGNGTGSNENPGGTNGEGNNNPETGNPNAGNNPNPGNPSPGLDPNTCLGDLNNTFTSGILINGDNNLGSAQQTVNIHLVVPGREAVP
jgi:hypothetical protein